MTDDLDKRLREELHAFDLDSQYTVLEVLKESDMGRTEKVASSSGTILIRKYVDRTSAQSSEYPFLFGLDDPAFPRIIAQYSYSEQYVFIMEYVEGQTLRSYIEDRGMIPTAQAIRLALQICAPISDLHRLSPNPLIHRDIKPSNIMVQPDGSVKIIDFGIARRFKEGRDSDTSLLGTVGYAAPEQFGFGQTDARTDIYAIGMTLYAMVSGKEPTASTRNLIASGRAGLDEPLQSIVYTCTMLDPEDRYQDVQALMEELQGARTNAETRLDAEIVAPTALEAEPKNIAAAVPSQASATAAPKDVAPAVAQNQAPRPPKEPWTWERIQRSKAYSIAKWLWIIGLSIVFWPFFLLCILMPVFASELSARTLDYWLQVLVYWGLGFFWFAVPYVLLTNFARIRSRARFFSKRRWLKVVAVIAGSLLIGAIWITGFESMHSADYKTHYGVQSAIRNITTPE